MLYSLRIVFCDGCFCACIPVSEIVMDVYKLALEAFRAGRADLTRAYLLGLDESARKRAEVLALLGMAYLQTGEAGLAASTLLQAVKAKPSSREYKLHAAQALRAAGRLDEAESILRVMLRQKSEPEVKSLLATICKLSGKLDEAARLYEQVLAMRPDDLAARFNLGQTWQQLASYRKAMDCYARLLQRAPNDWQAWFALGESALLDNVLNEAEKALSQAVKLKPDYPRTYKALAALYVRLGRLDQVETVFRQGVQACPLDARLVLGLATCLLGRGEFDEGWRIYLRRNDWKTGAVTEAQPMRKRDLQEKKVFVRQDQGLGDELMFLRYAPCLKANGAHVTYYVSPLMRAMLLGHPAIDALVDEGQDYPSADIAMLTSDLPYVCMTRQLDDIPPPLPLTPDPVLVIDVDKELHDFGKPPYVGVTWEAGTRDDEYAMHKKIDPEALGKLLGELECTVVILQRNPDADDMRNFLAGLGRPAIDKSALNADLSAMLALLSQLDDYVGVSNTNMHLHASLGKAARVLLPYPAEWRWLAENKPTPWMPGFITYRQDRLGNWDAALAGLLQDLQAEHGKPQEGK